MEVIKRHFKIATIPPFIFALIIGLLLIVTHDGSSYKSEWFTSDGFVETVILTLILSGVIILLSTTIYLNNQTKFKNNPLVSLISWTLLPGLLCLFIIYQEINNFTGGSDIDGMYPGNRLIDGYIMSVGFLHLLFLIISFIRFRRTKKV